MTDLIVESDDNIELVVGTQTPVELEVSEAFIDRGGANLMPNKNATASTSQVVVQPDAGYDGMEKVTIAAIPMGESTLDIFYSGNKVTAQSMITRGGYFEQYTGTIVEDYFPSGSVSVPATTITPNTNISVNTNGLVSVGVTGSQSITPSVQAGFISSGTAGTVSVSGGGNYQLPVEMGISVTPSTSQMTVDVDGKFMLGDIVVAPIPSQYIVPSGTKQITANGTGIDVAQYAAVDVAVSGGGDTPWSWKKDGDTHIWVKPTEGSKTTTLNLKTSNASYPITIDWGDGSATETHTSTSASDHAHTYSDTDLHEIVMSTTGGTATISIAAQTRYLLYAIELSNTRSWSIGALQRSMNLRYVHFGSNSITNNYAFASCYSLEEFIAPSFATNIAQYYFQYCGNLHTLDLGSATRIDSNSFESSGLEKITIPSSVASIATQAFRYTYGMVEMHLKAASPITTLANTAAFSNTLSDLKIYVPYSADHSVLNEYKAATNWSTYASQIYEEDAP